jgi:hypothetical protein
MFWTRGKETLIEPYNKFKFVAMFNNFQQTPSNPLNVLGGDLPSEFSDLRVFVKRIDAPKINFEFERAYANEYVDYFQQGSIHWEPINITFIDVARKTTQEFDTLRRILDNYVSSMNTFNNSTQEFQDNKTNIVDLPAFCESIRIASLSHFYEESKTVNYNNAFIITRPRITKIDFGTLDYGSDDINEITVTVVPEWCSNQNQTDSI